MLHDFFDAVADADMPRIRSMISGNVPLNISDRDGRTALHLACMEGREEVVKLLIKSRANLDTEDVRGNQPIEEAIHQGFKTIVDIMSRAGAKQSRQGRADLECELCCSAALGNLDKVKSLVECSVSVNATDYGSRSALHLASSNGHTDVVRFLLEASADVNTLDRNGRTAMDDAKDAGYKPILDLLCNTMNMGENEPDLHIGASAGHFNWIESFFSVNYTEFSCATSVQHAPHAPVLDPVRLLDDFAAESGSKSQRRRAEAWSPSPVEARDVPARHFKSAKLDAADCATAPRRCASQPVHSAAAAGLGHQPARYRARTAARATVVCIDIKGFTERCAAMSAGAAGEWVADFYARVDRAAAACGVRKADTRGDCCICVANDEDDAGGGAGADGGDCGTVPPQLSSQATRALAFATAVHAELAGAGTRGGGGGERRPISVRMGVATGAVSFLAGDAAAAGFAGVRGEAVSAAARMEALSRPGVAVVHETAAAEWAAEMGRRPPRTACCRAGKGGGAGLERAAAYDCAAGRFVGASGAAELLPEAGLRSLGRGEWPALLLRQLPCL